MSASLGRGSACRSDAYLQLVQETCDDVGFVQGLWEFRHFADRPVMGSIRSAALGEGVSSSQ
jgi:hypothetical protein